MQHRQKQLLQFGLLSLFFYLLWFFGYEQWLAHDGRLDTFLSDDITQRSAATLRLLGFQAATLKHNLVGIDGKGVVIVGHPCNGLVLYALFAGFVLAFPGAARHKAWFILLGLGLIYLINILRVVGLALNHVYAHRSVEFNHHYTFTFVVYSCILLLWLWWVKQFAQPATPVAAAV